jgi:hypothetical protein
MFWETDACYRIKYDDNVSITFQIVGELPLATHKIRVRNLATGKECYLFDLLLTRWVDFGKIECPQVTVNPQTIEMPDGNVN